LPPTEEKGDDMMDTTIVPENAGARNTLLADAGSAYIHKGITWESFRQWIELLHLALCETHQRLTNMIIDGIPYCEDCHAERMRLTETVLRYFERHQG
jgi:hypothetical protein